MNKIRIKKNINGDTRVADHIPTMNEFVISNYNHRIDVYNMMSVCAEEIKDIGDKHDWTKTTSSYESMFYKDFIDTMEGHINFKEGKWYKEHCKLERHHLLSYCPDDVNLFDVLEMICDCVCAGMARTGEVRPLEIDESILLKAVNNTTKLLADHVIVEE